MSQFPWLVEEYYSQGISAYLGHALSTVTGFTLLSLAEWIVLGALGWFLTLGLRGLWSLRGNRSGWKRGLVSGLLHVGAAAAVSAALFYLLWGLNYSRPPLIERMGWQQWDRVPEADQAWEELERVASELIRRSNQAYREAFGGDQWSSGGAPIDRHRMDQDLEGAYARLAAKLELPFPWGRSKGPAKPLSSSLLTSYLGISGIYFPYTGEANFNHMVPDYQLPHTIAHEKAHQRGIAGEDEANFFGFLACLEAEHPYVRYSGLAFAQRQLLNEIYPRNPHLARRLSSRILHAIRMDIRQGSQFWRRFQGPASKVGQAVNDSYLRLHGVDGGIRSYTQSTRLILVYLRQNGGRF